MTGYTYRESSAIARRKMRAAETFASAAAAIGPIERGMYCFLLTRGQFSLIDIVHHVVNQLGPGCHASLWTWAISHYESESLGSLLVRGELASFRMIVDYSCAKREVGLLNRFRDQFGDDCIRVLKTHCKIVRLWQDGPEGLRILGHGSCNLNSNPRFEQVSITEGGPEFEVVAGVEAGLPVLPRVPSHDQVLQATGLGPAWSDADLQKVVQTTGSKVWHP